MPEFILSRQTPLKKLLCNVIFFCSVIFCVQGYICVIAQDGPNILLIIADDFGVDASPCYNIGAEKPTMPTLESLCQTGLVFENMWVNQECTPTRATILTGKYGFRTDVGSAGDKLSTDEMTIQRLLREQTTYAAAVIGKWHLAGRSRDGSTLDLTHPEKLGVPYFAGVFEAALRDYSRVPWVENGKATVLDGYATTLITDTAINWLTTQDGPWFLWLAYTAPHSPFHLPPKGLYSDTTLTGENIRQQPRPYYFAAAEAMDKELGRLLESLSEEERNNTVIMFIGDNGTPGQVVQTFPRERSKTTLYQGGISVPLIVSGAGVTRQGEREEALVNGVDLFATLADIAGTGVTMHEDGVSFKPFFAEEAEGRDFIYSEAFLGAAGRSRQQERENFENAWTIRDKQYKYIQFESGREELYDLLADSLETTNIMANYPDIAERLREQGETLRMKE
ncbi:MAG: sulfatase-like hydrolase/transferase [Trueperaceae bacterium]